MSSVFKQHEAALPPCRTAPGNMQVTPLTETNWYKRVENPECGETESGESRHVVGDARGCGQSARC